MDEDNRKIEVQETETDDDQIDETLQITEELLVILGEAWARIDLLESQVKILKLGKKTFGQTSRPQVANEGNGVIIIDASKLMQGRLRARISSLGFEVVGTSGSGKHGSDMVARLKPQLVILDPQMQDSSGIECLRTIRRDNPELKIILCTGKVTTGLSQEFIKHDISEILAKPIKLDRFVSAVRKCMTFDVNPEELDQNISPD